MNKDTNLGRVLALLLLTLLMSFGLYFLPDQLFGYTIKKVDLLSDFKIKKEKVSLDSLALRLEREADSLVIDSVELKDSMMRAAGMDSIALTLRDSLYKTVYAVQGADSPGSHIEDYTVGHIGLKRFFAALQNRQQLNRPVRVAFLGDSFIEGDIMVADFRSGMQQAFGGRGVGFVPVTSVAAHFRPTVEQTAEGWQTRSMLTDKEQAYTLSGMMFEPLEEEASIHVRTVNRYPELEACSSLKFIYERNVSTEMRLVCNASVDTAIIRLPVTDSITQYEVNGNFTEADFRFRNTDDFRALGIAMEDNVGIVVDNFSLRGHSGMLLGELDSTRCRALNAIRTYDLIILQYGLNVVSDSVMQYGWYGKRMVEAIHHVRHCFPEADVLMLSVSDRSRQEDGEFETMPAVLALLHTQRKAAKRAGIPFWDVFGAMGGENSMVRFVENNWASKDYTHLSFRGGKEIAKALLKALMAEKEFYDEAEKVVIE